MSDHVAAAYRNGDSATAPVSGRQSERSENGRGISHLAARAATHGQEFLSTTLSALEPRDATARSMRFWLLRASFGLFALASIMCVTLTALGLLDVAEAAVVLGPVLTMAAMVAGVVLGERGD